MAYGKSIKFDPLRSLANNMISGNYALVGSLFTNAPIRILSIRNLTDQPITFGFGQKAPVSDGTADNDIVPASGGVVYDFSANSTPQSDIPFFPEQTGVWARYAGSAPSSGSVYVIAIYCQGD